MMRQERIQRSDAAANPASLSLRPGRYAPLWLFTHRAFAIGMASQK